MSFINDVAGVLVFLTPIAAVFVYWYVRQLAARSRQLQEDLASLKSRESSLQSEITSLRQRSTANTTPRQEPRGEKAPKEAPRPARAESKKPAEAAPKETQRLRELDDQVHELRRQIEQAQRLVKTRDSDVHALKEEIESLHVSLERFSSMPAVTPPVIQRVEAPPPPPIKSAAPAPTPEEIDSRWAEAGKLAEEAERVRRDAQSRANSAELEARRSKERLERLDKRAHEILGRLLASEKEQRRLQRLFEDQQHMYAALKGQYEVARDTLVTFRDRFNVVIPTEAGVPLYGPIEDHLELEEEEQRARPRSDGRSRRPPREEEQHKPVDTHADSAVPSSDVVTPVQEAAEGSA